MSVANIDLESVVEKESLLRNVGNAGRLRSFLANTAAAVTSSILLGLPNELFIAKLPAKQIVRSRIMNTTCAVLGGDPYERFSGGVTGRIMRSRPVVSTLEWASRAGERWSKKAKYYARETALYLLINGLAPEHIPINAYQRVARVADKAVTLPERLVRNSLLFTLNTALYTAFWMPLYAGTLAVAGASWQKIQTACASGLAISVATGWPYGEYQGWLRRKFGLHDPDYTYVRQPQRRVHNEFKLPGAYVPEPALAWAT